MKHRVELALFEKDCFTGLAHKNSTDLDVPFDPFWDGIGIFHDVFEHWFEDIHPYFKGVNAFNQGGEITAMGGALYYTYTLGVYNRDMGNGNFFDAALNTNVYSMADAIAYGHTDFGDTLECGVPELIESENSYIESAIIEHMKRLSSYKLNVEDSQDEKTAKKYKRSITVDKVAKLYHYGYHLASNLVPRNHHNMMICAKFIEFWDEFTTMYSSEGFNGLLKGITFEVGKKRTGNIHWRAVFNTYYPFDDFTITSNRKSIPKFTEIFPEDKLEMYF